MVSISKLRNIGKVQQANENFISNIPLQIEKYEKDDATGQSFAIGTNLHNGQETSITLANKEQFIKFFTDPNLDITLRTNKAASFISKRNTMEEFSRNRGNKSVPTNGVISFTNVRKDPETGNLIARWANGINHDPSIDKTLVGSFNIRSKLLNINNQQVSSSVISYIDNKNNINPYTSNNIKQDIDNLLSGQYSDIPAPVRSSIFLSMSFSDGNKGLFLPSSPKIIQFDQTTSNKFVNSEHTGLEAALNDRKLDQYTQTTAVVLAALYDIPFQNLHLSEKNTPEQVDLHKEIYDAIKNQEIPIAISQALFFTPTLTLNNSFLNQKMEQTGNIIEKPSKNSNFLDRGWFDGYATARFKSEENPDAVFEPKIIQVESNRFLPSKTSDAFIRITPDFIAENIIITQSKKEASIDQSQESLHDNTLDEDEIACDNSPM